MDSFHRRLSNEFGVYKDLVEFLITTQSVLEPILFGLLYSISWKDTRSATIACRIIVKLLPVLSNDLKLFDFLGKDIVSAALKGLTNEY